MLPISVAISYKLARDYNTTQDLDTHCDDPGRHGGLGPSALSGPFMSGAHTAVCTQFPTPSRSGRRRLLDWDSGRRGSDYAGSTAGGAPVSRGPSSYLSTIPERYLALAVLLRTVGMWGGG